LIIHPGPSGALQTLMFPPWRDSAAARAGLSVLSIDLSEYLVIHDREILEEHLLFAAQELYPAAARLSLGSLSSPSAVGDER
jgi:hypothetical protein